MVKQQKSLAEAAEKNWEARDLAALEKLRHAPGAAKVSEVQYFIGLALNALNQRREAIECWRKARDLDPQNENATRTLAYELLEQAPVNAAELFYELYASQQANADDLTCLGEIHVKQDRLGEARGWLERAIRLDPDNSLALLAMATLYAQVRDASLALDYLQKAAETDDIDLSDIASAPEFEFLWHDPRFKRIASANGQR
jgi:tetratricopeptide (TPR) repeat protein